jgi:acetyl esterase/lipase
VYANVPVPGNPSANPNPGLAGGGMPRIANSPNAAPGTLDLHLDVLQVSSAKPTPVVIQLHGGGWIRGDRPSSYGTFSALLAAGMSVVTVDYRVGKEAPAPAAIGDVRCAMAWVKANAAKYNFDLTRVVIYGASAGGHLALMAGYAPASFNPPGCSDQPKVAAVLDFYGPTNLAEAINQHGSSDSVHQWLGLEKPLVPYTGTAPTTSGPDVAPVVNGGGQGPRWATPNEAVLARARELYPARPAAYVYCQRRPRPRGRSDAGRAVEEGAGRSRRAGWAGYRSRRRPRQLPQGRGRQGNAAVPGIHEGTGDSALAYRA